jgi:ABC-type dipeptide/oligopeptide/nickel transport system permease component
MTTQELSMIAKELFFICLSALVVATTIALPLSMIPALQSQRKHFWERFGYAFSNWGVPVWCVIELLLWLITKRWTPWIP